MSSATSQPWGITDEPIGRLLSARARGDGDYLYAREGERRLTIGELDRLSRVVAANLTRAGLGRDSRVATMLSNSIDHIVLFFALARLGACNIPVNLHLRGEGLHYILEHSQCTCLIAEGELDEVLRPIIAHCGIGTVFWRQGTHGGRAFAELLEGEGAVIDSPVDADDSIYVSYTSGTTGMPKGVMLTDRMLRIAGWSAARVSDARDGDVFHMWAPFYHIGGAETLVLAVQKRVTLALVPRFSASHYWDEVREFGATQMHFLGGVLAILLKQPPSARDRDHTIRVAWGGGCPEALWKPFEKRFGVPLRECYGLTECASFATQNLSGKVGSVGQALPFFDVTIVDDDGNRLGPNQRGEVIIRERMPGLLTRGYWRNPEATAAMLDNGALRTGDLAYVDGDGDFFYLGRKKDSLRRRGENISAFEVERILNQHPDIEESAIVGVANDLADEDILTFVRLKDGASLEPLDLIKWCEGRMAYFQVPRYVAVVPDFPRTPSQRIRKELLPRDIGQCWDLQKSGYQIAR